MAVELGFYIGLLRCLAIVLAAYIVSQLYQAVELQEIARVVGAFIVIAIALFVYSANRSFKAVDVQLKCQERFDKLNLDKDELAKKFNEDQKGEKGDKDNSKLTYLAKQYWDRYWMLQFEQYQYFVKGYIEKDIYYIWLSFRNSQWDNKDLNEIGIEYSKGWKIAKEKFESVDQIFTRIIDEAHNGKGDPEAIQLIVEGKIFHRKIWK